MTQNQHDQSPPHCWTRVPCFYWNKTPSTVMYRHQHEPAPILCLPQHSYPNPSGNRAIVRVQSPKKMPQMWEKERKQIKPALIHAAESSDAACLVVTGTCFTLMLSYLHNMPLSITARRNSLQSKYVHTWMSEKSERLSLFHSTNQSNNFCILSVESFSWIICNLDTPFKGAT